MRALWHACSYWVASAVLAVGGTWCLRSGTYTVCYVEGTNRTKNVTMSWDCLMYDQTPECEFPGFFFFPVAEEQMRHENIPCCCCTSAGKTLDPSMASHVAYSSSAGGTRVRLFVDTSTALSNPRIHPTTHAHTHTHTRAQPREKHGEQTNKGDDGVGSLAPTNGYVCTESC